MLYLTKKKIIIATHVYATGPTQDLKKWFLQEKVNELMFIGHPLFFDKKLTGSGYEIYIDGDEYQKKYGKIKKIPLLVSYFKDMCLNLYWVIRSGKKWDIFIGADNLNAISGVILKKLGRVNKVVYYVVDYNPQRFANSFMNQVYHWIDQKSAKNADQVWNLSRAMEKARNEYFNFRSNNQKEIPLGIWLPKNGIVEEMQFDPHQVVYMGHILKKQGIQYAIGAIPKIILKIPQFKLIIIGDGPYRKNLEKICQNLKVEKYVRFMGFLNDEEMEKVVRSSALGLALYEKYEIDGSLTFTNFADPGKIKQYLMAGIPIITTDVPPNACEIEKNKCGFISPRSSQKLANLLSIVLINSEELKKYRKNALEFSKKFNWNIIFSQAFNSLK